MVWKKKKKKKKLECKLKMVVLSSYQESQCIKLSEAFMVLGGNQKKQPAHLYDLVTTVPFYMPVPCIKPGE